MKRGIERLESFDSDQSTTPLSLSQRSIDTTSSQAQEQLSYSDRGWKSIFPELIGTSLNNENNVPVDENAHHPDFGDTFFSADLNGANIESWSTEELSDGYQIQNGDVVSAGLAQDDSYNQDLVCYGMVSYLSNQHYTHGY